MLGAAIVSLAVKGGRLGAMGGGTTNDVIESVYAKHMDDSDKDLLDAIFAIVRELPRRPRSQSRLESSLLQAANRHGYFALLGLIQIAWTMAEQVAQFTPDRISPFEVVQAMALAGELGMEADGEGHTDQPYKPYNDPAE